MKGAIFTIFQEMVEEKFGFDGWETIISQSKLASEGIYTSAENYDDDEIFQLVGALSAHSGIAVPELVEVFGHYLFPHLAHSLPEKMMDYDDLWSFLEAIHGVIHVEVKKLHPDAMTPEIIVVEKADTNLLVRYKSPRKLCFLALGLIHRAAEHFNTEIIINHECCMHEQNDHCLLRITKQ